MCVYIHNIMNMYDVFYSPRGGNKAVPKALSFRMMCMSANCTSEAMTAAGHDDSSPVEDGPEELAEVVTVMVLSVGQSQLVGTE